MPVPLDSSHHLEALGQTLRGLGYTARVVTPLGKPKFLYVALLGNAHLAETVTCGDAEGELFFVWSWGTPIAPVRHVTSAAERIAYVLNPKASVGC